MSTRANTRVPGLPPTPQELRQSLANLHRELGSAPRLDEGSVRLLREVLSDIEHLLDGDAHRLASSAAGAELSARTPAAPTAQPMQATEAMQTAPHRLAALAVEFETRHPVLAASLRQFVDLLGRAGL